MAPPRAGSKDDPIWNYIDKEKSDGTHVLICKSCKKRFKNGTIKRMKLHLACIGDKNITNCLEVDEDTRLLMRKILEGGSIEGSVDITVNENVTAFEALPGFEVTMAIGKFFLDSNIPFAVLDSPYFKNMLETVSSHGSILINCKDYESWVLNEVDKEIENLGRTVVEEKSSGCSVLLHEILSETGHRFITVSIFCNQKSIVLDDFINCEVKTEESLFEVVNMVLEHVGVKNVVQIITNGSGFYDDLMKRVIRSHPSISCTRCAVKSMDLFFTNLKKMDWISAVIEQAKSVTKFIYGHPSVLKLTREKTGTDLIVAGLSDISTDFYILKRISTIAELLRSTVDTITWLDDSACQTAEGLAVRNIIHDGAFWSKCATIVCFTNPLLSFLTCVDKDEQLGRMGAAIYLSKKAMRKQVEDYASLWAMTDDVFSQIQLCQVALYLSRDFFQNAADAARDHIRSLVYLFFGRYVTDKNDRNEILAQLLQYHSRKGDFGTILAKESNVNSVEWWSLFGAKCPDLRRLATRLLTQPCCLTGFTPTKLYTENRELIRRLAYLRNTKKAFVIEKPSEKVLKEWIGEACELPFPEINFEKDLGLCDDGGCFDEDSIFKEIE